ncbi:MAG: aminoglycoside phosphotransferase family protein [Rhizomicrobium sp.]
MPTEPREPKPDWRDVPPALREKIAAIAGEPIVEAATVWGGFGPAATFALTTTSGARHFCKGTHPGNTPAGHAAMLRECRNLASFPELARFGPAWRGMAQEGDWHLAVLEFVDRVEEIPPWTSQAVRRAIDLIAAFHAATPDRAAQALAEGTASDLIAQTQNWHSLRDAAVRQGFLALFGDPQAAALWLEPQLDRLIALKDRAAALGGPRGWMHMDIRSDNLVFAGDGLLLVDWPVLSYGPQLLDIAFFLPSLAGESGPSCAEGLKLYERATGFRFADEDIAVAAAAVAGFFAARAGTAEIPALPRLRWIQKLQLFPALDWLSACLGIEFPPLPRPFRA